MITAVDSSVLWAILKEEPSSDLWLEALILAATEGPLVISPIAFAEIAPSEDNLEAVMSFLEPLQIRYDPISPEASFLAGTLFSRYRRAGGPREHLVPDFLIAAHAFTQADRLAALDQGYLRRWFPKLTLLQPGDAGTGTSGDAKGR